MAAPEAELVLKWEREQARLRESVKEEDTEDWQRSPDFSGLERVGGVDLSFIKGDDINACAHLVVLTYPHMKVLYEDCKMVTLNTPYVAGFLGFREAPPLLQALEKLKNVQPNLMPQVLFVDGNGLFHYREFGLACHLGVLSDLPCVGVAKNLLHVEGVVRSEEHQSQALRSSQSSIKPVYVSVGHRISLDTAVRLTHTCCLYRVPEPIRQYIFKEKEIPEALPKEVTTQRMKMEYPKQFIHLETTCQLCIGHPALTSCTRGCTSYQKS
uniref:Endonuclease V n=1 Tax=Sinocyclocheilus rhinocerous TaxID=307959 RepID=A0A673JIA9_9TELE